MNKQKFLETKTKMEEEEKLAQQKKGFFAKFKKEKKKAPPIEKVIYQCIYEKNGQVCKIKIQDAERLLLDRAQILERHINGRMKSESLREILDVYDEQKNFEMKERYVSTTLHRGFNKKEMVRKTFSLVW